MTTLGFSESEIELAQLARAAGVASERERVIAILKSYAPHLITDGLMQMISARTHENQEQK